MEYRELGDSGIKISAIGLGTMTFGEQNTVSDGHEQLSYAIENGVNFIDTAEMYAVPGKKETQGSTESIIGTWLKKQKREKLVLASKAAGPAPWLEYLRGGPTFSSNQLKKALEKSLERLQTDYLDLYQLHWPERKTNYFGQLDYSFDVDDQWEDNMISVLETLDSFVKEGKVRHVGVSNETAWGTMRYIYLAKQLGIPKIQSIQNPYSLLNRTFDGSIAEICSREKVSLLAYSPLAFGMLTGKYLANKLPEGARLTLFPKMARYSGEAAVRATKQYYDIENRHGVNFTQMSLAFVNSRGYVASNIIGATTMDQLKENIGSINLKLSNDLIKELDQVHSVIPNPAP